MRASARREGIEPPVFRFGDGNFTVKLSAHQCPRRELNSRVFRHEFLGLARLPIPPLGQKGAEGRIRTCSAQDTCFTDRRDSPSSPPLREWVTRRGSVFEASYHTRYDALWSLPRNSSRQFGRLAHCQLCYTHIRATSES